MNLLDMIRDGIKKLDEYELQDSRSTDVSVSGVCDMPSIAPMTDSDFENSADRR